MNVHLPKTKNSIYIVETQRPTKKNILEIQSIGAQKHILILTIYLGLNKDDNNNDH